MSETALITGASSGIGLELADIMASNGINVVLTARSEEKLNALKQRIEQNHTAKAYVIAADLTDEQTPELIYNKINELNLNIHYLINNAGFGDYGYFHNANWSKQAGMIDLNIKSLTHLTHLFSRPMIERGQGKIMNVASTASFQAGPLMSVYYATKHYVLAFSEAIAEELEDFGITVTALCPGPTESGFQSKAEMEESRLINTFTMPSSREVANYGYRAMMKGKRVAVHGWLNKILVQSIRFTPRKLASKIVHFLQSEQ